MCLLLFILSVGVWIYGIHEEKDIVIDIGTQAALQDREKYEELLINHSFIIEGNVKDSVIIYARNYYLAIPDAIREVFEKSGWVIVLTDKNIQKEYYEGDVSGRLSGLTNYKEKRIYIHGGYYDVYNSLLHEMGHFADFISGGQSIKEEFIKIYKKEKENLQRIYELDSHIVSNEQEYFAEVFARYIVEKDYIKKKTPKTYEYMQNNMKNWME